MVHFTLNFGKPFFIFYFVPGTDSLQSVLLEVKQLSLPSCPGRLDNIRNTFFIVNYFYIKICIPKIKIFFKNTIAITSNRCFFYESSFEEPE